MRSMRISLLVRTCLLKSTTIIAVLCIVTSICGGQTAPAGPPPDVSALAKLSENPELLAFILKLQREIRFPMPRSTSRLLPLLPNSTTYYAAFSNYGDVAHQALTIFQQELQKNSALREWCQHSGLAAGMPKVEDTVEKVYQVSQYLGDEIVVSGSIEVPNPKLLIIAEIRKPGLKNILQPMLGEPAGKSNFHVRVLDPQELASVPATGPAQGLAVLVRPDLVIAAPDVATLRSFDARLERGTRDFASTPFGQRVSQSYEGGVSVLTAADLQRILTQIPQASTPNPFISTFQRTGLADMKHFVWEHKNVAGQSVSQTELSFIGPRRGVASWLAPPAPLGSLDFASPNAIAAGTVRLKCPAQIFDDVVEIARESDSRPFAGLSAFEQALGMNVKEDLLKQLTGEITLEVDNAVPPLPGWRAILRVRDANRLQQALNRLLAAAHMPSEQVQDAGVTYHTLRVPSAKAPIEVAYAFVDGYLVLASSHEAA